MILGYRHKLGNILFEEDTTIGGLVFPIKGTQSFCSHSLDATNKSNWEYTATPHFSKEDCFEIGIELMAIYNILKTV